MKSNKELEPPNIERASLQELFDYVVGSLIQQGRPAITDDGSCQYRSGDGCKCAFGHLIPEAQYKPELEENPLKDVWSKLGWKPLEDTQKMSLLIGLQTAHDHSFYDLGFGAGYTNADWVTEFRKAARKLGDFYHLDTTIINKET